MAYSSLDPVTGAPQFADADAPDPAVNPTQVSDYAAQVGNRLVGTTAERTAYPYDREGLRWYDTTLNIEFVHDGTGWVVASLQPLNATFTPTRFQHGRTNVTTDATGYFTVTFPVSFPNACDRVIPVSADPTAYFGGFAVNGMTHLAFSARVNLFSASFNVDWVAYGR